MFNEVKRSIVVSGHAVAPKGTVLFEINKMMTVALEIDWESGEIMKAETTFMTTICNSFFRSLVIGQNVLTDYDKIKSNIVSNLHVDSQKSLLKAFGIAAERFRSLRVKQSDVKTEQ